METVFKNHPAFPLETLFENSPTRPENNVLTALNPREDLTDFLFPVHAILSVTVTMTAGRTVFFPQESHHNKEHAPHQHGQPECRGVNPI
ncbi:hypothetical protein LAD59_23565 [Klebsiella pneumoniae]|nr:hypothetical protein [Klebsiella pneumoniae]